jgi:hypothetical protein
LYNPPGVGSSGSVAIPEGKTEAAIPLTANGGAELGEHKIVVLGRAAVGNGAVEVSSQLATLNVAAPYVGFAFQKASAEQGQDTDVVIKVAKNTDFDGPAKVELLGLPAGVTTTAGEFNKDTKDLVFKIKTQQTSPAGRHTSLLCRAIITGQGEPITHMLYGGELRIDVPLPPKPAATTAAKPPPQPTPLAEKPPEKRLSPLEKLRQDRQKSKDQSAGK